MRSGRVQAERCSFSAGDESNNLVLAVLKKIQENIWKDLVLYFENQLNSNQEGCSLKIKYEDLF